MKFPIITCAVLSSLAFTTTNGLRFGNPIIKEDGEVVKVVSPLVQQSSSEDSEADESADEPTMSKR